MQLKILIPTDSTWQEMHDMLPYFAYLRSPALFMGISPFKFLQFLIILRWQGRKMAITSQCLHKATLLNIQTDRQTDRDRQKTDGRMFRQMDRQTDRETDKQTDTDRQMDGQMDGHTDRQSDLDKQHRPRSAYSASSIWSGSTLFPFWTHCTLKPHC